MSSFSFCVSSSKSQKPNVSGGNGLKTDGSQTGVSVRRSAVTVRRFQNWLPALTENEFQKSANLNVALNTKSADPQKGPGSANSTISLQRQRGGKTGFSLFGVYPGS